MGVYVVFPSDVNYYFDALSTIKTFYCFQLLGNVLFAKKTFQENDLICLFHIRPPSVKNKKLNVLICRFFSSECQLKINKRWWFIERGFPVTQKVKQLCRKQKRAQFRGKKEDVCRKEADHFPKRPRGSSF